MIAPRIIAASFSILLALGTASGQPDESPTSDSGDPSRPNIVLIMADDLGLYELGAYGQAKIRTPNLDRIAREGIRFDRFYSASTVCAPSRASLMTGLHTGVSPIRGNRERGGWGPEEPEGQTPLPTPFVTIAERLQQLGYSTSAFGKWGLGGPGNDGHPCNQGFDHFYGYLCQRVAHNYYPTHLWRNHDVDVLHGNNHFRAHQRINEPLADEAAYNELYRGSDYAPEEIISEAESWIGTWAERSGSSNEPFFLYYASVIPHVALQAPQAFVDVYPAEWDEEHYLGNRGYLPNARPRATYAAMITYLDHAVGRLRDAIERAGALDNTLILFTSDNGTTYAGGVDRAFFGSLGSLRGHKTNLYEGGIRVPMLAWWPGVIDPLAHTDVAAQLPDLYPTILDAVGAEHEPGITGISLWPTLIGSGEQQTHKRMYWEFPEGRQQQAILMDGRWKAIRPNLKKDLGLELYDVISDPGETRDVSPEYPGLVERAIQEMREMRTPSTLFHLPALDEN